MNIRLIFGACLTFTIIVVTFYYEINRPPKLSSLNTIIHVSLREYYEMENAYPQTGDLIQALSRTLHGEVFLSEVRKGHSLGVYHGYNFKFEYRNQLDKFPHIEFEEVKSFKSWWILILSISIFVLFCVYEVCVKKCR